MPKVTSFDLVFFEKLQMKLKVKLSDLLLMVGITKKQRCKKIQALMKNVKVCRCFDDLFDDKL